jgi:hypothetical protein
MWFGTFRRGSHVPASEAESVWTFGGASDVVGSRGIVRPAAPLHGRSDNTAAMSLDRDRPAAFHCPNRSASDAPSCRGNDLLRPTDTVTVSLGQYWISRARFRISEMWLLRCQVTSWVSEAIWNPRSFDHDGVLPIVFAG